MLKIDKCLIKCILAVLSFVMGCVFGLLGILIVPQGIIDSSVLIMTGQLLVLSATFLGIDVNFDLAKQKFKSVSKKNNKEE